MNQKSFLTQKKSLQSPMELDVFEIVGKLVKDLICLLSREKNNFLKTLLRLLLDLEEFYRLIKILQLLNGSISTIMFGKA
jgi:hypothetical protein